MRIQPIGNQRDAYIPHLKASHHDVRVAESLVLDQPQRHEDTNAVHP
jgi:hypothetical protein